MLGLRRNKLVLFLEQWLEDLFLEFCLFVISCGYVLVCVCVCMYVGVVCVCVCVRQNRIHTCRNEVESDVQQSTES